MLFDNGQYPNQIPAPYAYSYDTKTDKWQQLAGLPEDRQRARRAGKERLMAVNCTSFAALNTATQAERNGLFDEYES